MKRDADLIRQLLLAIEHQSEPFETKDVSILDYDAAQTAYHAALVADTGFIEGTEVSTMGGPNFHVRRMTSAGHDFLEAVRDPAVWQAVGERISAAGGGFDLEAVKEVALAMLKEELGL